MTKASAKQKTSTLVAQMNSDESTDVNDVDYNSIVVRSTVMLPDDKNAACDDINDGWVGDGVLGDCGC